MQTTTTVSLPKNLAKEIEKELKKGNFASRSEFFRAAVKTYLRLLKGDLSWEIISIFFKTYAKEKALTPQAVLREATNSQSFKKKKA